MDKICLVEGDEFSVGIEVQHIIDRTVYNRVPRTGVDMFHLGALLSRRLCSSPEQDAACLHLQTAAGPLFLLVDRIVGEIESTDADDPVVLPAACPPLSRQLCPRVMIYDDSVVLIMDPTQIRPVFGHFRSDIGQLQEKISSADDTSARKKRGRAEKEEAVKPKFFSNQEMKKKAVAAIDEETVKKIMIWTVTRFKERKDGAVLHLGVDQLPPKLADMVRQKGVSENVIQYLIERILVRCQETVERETVGGKNAD